MEESVKGAVTPLSSLFPAEEAQKASKRVQDTITERQKELDQLQDFIADNTNLVNLVQRLPDELHHDIMVPFGKAAFFPGRLIHTNEFLVLLGEGYYAERTSKQTTEILKRRGKVLESEVESLKTVMQDLKAEASFFEATAAEAAEGLVEIREDYIDEASVGSISKAGLVESDTPSYSREDNVKLVGKDEEYAHMMSRIDELEKEELAAEIANESDEDQEYALMMSRMDELEKEELLAKSVSQCDEDAQTEAEFGHSLGRQSLDGRFQNSEEHYLSNLQKQSKDESKIKDSRKVHFQEDLSDQTNSESLKRQPIPEDGSSRSKSLALNESSAEKALKLPEVKGNVQTAPTSTNEAFTGSIVEHTPYSEKNAREQITASSKSTSQTTKPVSRFKMQRR